MPQNIWPSTTPSSGNRRSSWLSNVFRRFRPYDGHCLFLSKGLIVKAGVRVSISLKLRLCNTWFRRCQSPYRGFVALLHRGNQGYIVLEPMAANHSAVPHGVAFPEHGQQRSPGDTLGGKRTSATQGHSMTPDIEGTNNIQLYV